MQTNAQRQAKHRAKLARYKRRHDEVKEIMISLTEKAVAHNTGLVNVVTTADLLRIRELVTRE
jgi:L-rhamnose mutarotase